MVDYNFTNDRKEAFYMQNTISTSTIKKVSSMGIWALAWPGVC